MHYRTKHHNALFSKCQSISSEHVWLMCGNSNRAALFNILEQNTYSTPSHNSLSLFFWRYNSSGYLFSRLLPASNLRATSNEQSRSNGSFLVPLVFVVGRMQDPQLLHSDTVSSRNRNRYSAFVLVLVVIRIETSSTAAVGP